MCAASPVGFSTIRHHIDYGLKTLPKYFKMLNVLGRSNISMVDIGTGPGKYLLEIEPLLPKNYKELVALDKDDEMVKYFNFLEKDPRILVRNLNIETPNLPEDLRGRFDFAFSSYCFTYVRKVKQAFLNSSDMLKPNGELTFIWCTKAHLYDVFKKISKIDRWAPYASDFKDWTNFFDNEEPLVILQKVVEESGLKVMKTEFDRDFKIRDATLDNFKVGFKSLDLIASRIPKYDLPLYEQDYEKIVLDDIVHIDENAEEDSRFYMSFPTLVLAAKKQ